MKNQREPQKEPQAQQGPKHGQMLRLRGGGKIIKVCISGESNPGLIVSTPIQVVMEAKNDNRYTTNADDYEFMTQTSYSTTEIV